MGGVARALADLSVKATSVVGLASCSLGMTTSVCVSPRCALLVGAACLVLCLVQSSGVSKLCMCAAFLAQQCASLRSASMEAATALVEGSFEWWLYILQWGGWQGERERLHALVRMCAGHDSFSEVCARVRAGSVHCE